MMAFIVLHSHFHWIVCFFHYKALFPFFFPSMLCWSLARIMDALLRSKDDEVRRKFNKKIVQSSMEIKIQQHTQDAEMTRHIHKDKKVSQQKSRKRKKNNIAVNISSIKDRGNWLRALRRLACVICRDEVSSLVSKFVLCFNSRDFFSSIICSITRLDVSPQKVLIRFHFTRLLQV